MGDRADDRRGQAEYAQCRESTEAGELQSAGSSPCWVDSVGSGWELNFAACAIRLSHSWMRGRAPIWWNRVRAWRRGWTAARACCWVGSRSGTSVARRASRSGSLRVWAARASAGSARVPLGVVVDGGVGDLVEQRPCGGAVRWWRAARAQHPGPHGARLDQGAPKRALANPTAAPALPLHSPPPG